jgi:hypothetical protein
MSETWRPVPNFERYYEVSSQGRVRRVYSASGTSPGRTLKPDERGRIRVWCWGKWARWKVKDLRECVFPASITLDEHPFPAYK